MHKTSPTILDQPASRPKARDAATRRAIEALGPWFHNLHLPGGIRTRPDHPLGDFPAYKWAEFADALPHDLAGQTALDVGCNAGFHSLELAKRGAYVTGVDLDSRFLKQARWASEQLHLEDQLELREAQVYDLGREPTQYDIILFLGVFYHLRYPLLALDILARKTRRLFVFQTLTMPGSGVAEVPEDFGFIDRQRMSEPGWPTMAFIEHKFSGDVTNWWAPNRAACEAMLRSAGLRPRRVGEETWVCTPDESALGSTKELLDAEYNAAAGSR